MRDGVAGFLGPPIEHFAQVLKTAFVGCICHLVQKLVGV